MQHYIETYIPKGQNFVAGKLICVHPVSDEQTCEVMALWNDISFEFIDPVSVTEDISVGKLAVIGETERDEELYLKIGPFEGLNEVPEKKENNDNV